MKILDDKQGMILTLPYLLQIFGYGKPRAQFKKRLRAESRGLIPMLSAS